MDTLAIQTISDGYSAGNNPTATRPNSLTSPSRNLIITGRGRAVAHQGLNPQSGVVGGRLMFNLPDGGYGGLGDGATAGIGAIVGLIAGAFAYIGQGLLTLNGVSRAVNASTALQIILRRLGLYTGANTGPYIAGLDPPGAPTIAEHSVNTSAVNSGTTSAVIWFVRSATGGRSRKSVPSNVLVVNGKKVRLTVSGADLTTAATFGYDRIGVGVTQWGFGAAGPHYAHPVNEGGEFAISSLTTVDGVANSVELEWASAQLQGQMLAPLEDYPPPAGVFAAALEDVLAVIGCYGDSTSGVSAASPGTAIAVSLPVFIESFPPDNLLFLPEIPVGVLPRPSGGFAFVGCKNSMHALTYTGGSPALSLQTVWASTGIAAGHNMFLGEGGRLYAFSNGRQGLVRIGERGEPETLWAAEMADEVSTWNPANVIGGWDNNNQLCVFGHNKTLIAFNSQIEKWCAPIDLTGVFSTNETLCACVTVGGQLFLATRDTVTTGNPLKLYAFDGGSGSTYEAYLPWVYSQEQADEVLQVDVQIRADNNTHPVNLRLYINGNRTTPARQTSVTLPSSGFQAGLQHLRPWRPNVRGAKSYCVYVSQRSTGGDCGLEVVRLSGERSGVVI